MPYKSERQRRYLHARHPEIAAKWDAEIRAKKKVSKRSEKDRAEAMGGAFGGAGALAGYGAADRYQYRRKDPWAKPGGYPSRKESIKWAVTGKGKYVLPAAAAVGAAGGYGLIRGEQKLRDKKVAKRMDPDKKLATQKKVQAASSIAGSTVGLTGLGMLLASKKYPKVLPQLPKVTAVGGGIGGVSGYNFASIQNQESKKKPPKQNVYVVRNKRQIKNIKSGLQPVTKGLDTMDFGLGEVHQGQNVISKRKWDTPESEAKQRQAEANGKRAATAGSVGATGALTWYGSRLAADVSNINSGGQKPSYATQKYNLKGQTQNMRQAYTHATKAGWNGADPIKRRQTVKPLLKFGARAVKNNPHAAAGKVGGTVALAGIGTSWALAGRSNKQRQAATSMRSANRRQQLKKEPVAKADWMNITEHQRRATDSRRTARRGDRAVGWGTALAAGAVAHRNGSSMGLGKPTVGQQTANVGRAIKTAPGVFSANHARGRTAAESARLAGTSLSNVARLNPHGTAMWGAGGLAAGGVATHIAGRVNEKRHNRAIAAQRRKRVTKAYNPEDKRHRRLDTAATSLSVAAGATGVGAAYHAKQAFGKKPYSYEVPSNRKGGKPSVKRNVGSGLRSEVLGSFGGKGKTASGFKGGVKSAGKAGALGLTAVGLAVGSDRVRQYKSGRGNTYRPLLRHS